MLLLSLLAACGLQSTVLPALVNPTTLTGALVVGAESLSGVWACQAIARRK